MCNGCGAASLGTPRWKRMADAAEVAGPGDSRRVGHVTISWHHSPASPVAQRHREPFFPKSTVRQDFRLHLKKNVLYLVACNGGGTGETGSPPNRKRDDRQARSRPEALLERAESLNKLAGPNDAKARPVEYWKGSATDQEDAYGEDTESSLKPPALSEWPGAEYFYPYFPPVPFLSPRVFLKNSVEIYVESQWKNVKILSRQAIRTRRRSSEDAGVDVD